MNYAITIGGLLFGLSIIIGVPLALFGIVMLLAGGMSDAPEAGAEASRQGCFVCCLGAAFVVGGVWGLLS
jgi:hypothetical protein